MQKFASDSIVVVVDDFDVHYLMFSRFLSGGELIYAIHRCDKVEGLLNPSKRLLWSSSTPPLVRGFTVCLPVFDGFNYLEVTEFSAKELHKWLDSSIDNLSDSSDFPRPVGLVDMCRSMMSESTSAARTAA